MNRNLLDNLARLVACLMALAAVLACADRAAALTPNSPEVKALIASGLKFLDTATETRFGGKCVVALAMIKSGVPKEHPKVVEALKACEKEDPAAILKTHEGIYTLGIAIIFLSEFDQKQYGALTTKFMQAMESAQKPHGGWGYPDRPGGDTSMTQYGALSTWSAKQVGVKTSVESVEKVANWLMRTQDPNGGFGYQAVDPGAGPPASQSPTLSMTAAALGSLLICANMLGHANIRPEDLSEEVPAVMKLVVDKKEVIKVSTKVDPKKLHAVVALGDGWLKKNGTGAEKASWSFYYLYAQERFMSFRELLEAKAPANSPWYDEGCKFLKEKMNKEGFWDGASGAAVDTSFALLFLCRSTKKAIEKVKAFGPGTLVGGRGLPSDVKDVKLRRGSIVAEHRAAGIDDLLKQLSDPNNADDEVNDNPEDIVLSSDEKTRAGQLDRLRQLVRAGAPEARASATKILARARNVKDVPVLIYAMSDPDRRVVLAASDGLNFVSRKFDGFKLPENWNEGSREEAIEKWKGWYLSIQPDANFEN